jgi:hypothetical protein
MDLGIPFQTTEVDGVPCFYADAPGPCTAGLLFRAGRADELLSNGGMTRLVQQLALYDLGRKPYDFSGHVTATTTAFYVSGDPVHVAPFLAHVCRALHDPPADRVEGERRAEAIEEEREETDVAARLLMMRFGAQGHGLPFYDQLGLRWLQPDHLRSWAGQWFTRGNAALWMTRPPAADLRLPLPEGPRMPPPEPHTMPGLELPAYAASGTDGVASTLVAPRSAAIRVAGRTVAGRTEASLHGRGLDHDVVAWQFPLTASLSHRHLAVRCTEEDAPAAVEAAVTSYDAVAGEGPTPDEVNEARDAAIRALADDEAVPGGLETMAVDELLGAPRRPKDDLAAEIEAVTTTEAAGALRDALATQLLVAPASVPKPAERLHPYPWFSRDRVQGRELKPVQRGADVRVIAGADGVSHISQASGQASTVRFADVAAALQESDGSLTLIGRDGAIVPLDPQALRGAGEVIADIERALPPHAIVPPRDVLEGNQGGINAVAGRKLQHRQLVETELQVLREQVGQEESIVTMAHATMGFKPGLLVVTDQRVMWLSRGDREFVQRELPYRDVTDVRMSRFPKDVVTVRSPAGETAFSQVRPKERGPEIVEEVQRRVAAQTQ